MQAKVLWLVENATILEDGHVVFVVEVLVETQYSVLTVRNGFTESVIV